MHPCKYCGSRRFTTPRVLYGVTYDVEHCTGCNAWQCNLVPVPNFTQQEFKIVKRKAAKSYVK